jgi:hypothetical protein
VHSRGCEGLAEPRQEMALVARYIRTNTAQYTGCEGLAEPRQEMALVATDT